MTSLKATLDFSRVNGSLAQSKPENAAALVVGLAQGETSASLAKGARAWKDLEKLSQAIIDADADAGKAGTVVTLLRNPIANPYRDLVGFGVGNPSFCHAQTILHWGGRLAQVARTRKFANVDIVVDSLYNSAASSKAKDAPKDFAGRPLPTTVPSLEDFTEKLALGLLLGLYEFTRYKSIPEGKKKPEEKTIKFRFLSKTLDTAKMKKLLERVTVLAESVYLCRDLGNTPGGDMPPAALAAAAQKAGREAGVTVTVLDEKKIQAEGMGGLWAVGKGSDNKPRFIAMEYNTKAKKAPTVVLVGKGVTFDTGGYSLKTGDFMKGMQLDKSGAASVIAAITALAKLKAPVNVVALVPAAENMISGDAQRVNDIYTASNGKTVEVLNTDAEGRLILGEALVYAKKYNPTCVIDVATLTGAVLVCLGGEATGLMGNNGALIDGYASASAKAGEKTWELPLFKAYSDDLKSKVADYRNIGSRDAGSSKAGCFLQFFTDYPWIHLDIAGTGMSPREQGEHCPGEGCSGVPVRGLVEFTENIASYYKA